MKKWVLIAAVLGLGILAFVLLKGSWEGLLGLKDSSYRVVSLSNGTSYFGKIRKIDGDFVVLEDVFYLRVRPAPSPAPGQKVASPAAAPLELAKPINDLYGPEDVLTLNRRHVLAIQTLKADSPVVKAIREYYGQKKEPEKKTDESKKGKVNVRAE